MNISTDFAPPFKLVSPFFIIGIFVYLFSVVLLFGFDPSSMHTLDSSILSWVHLFLLGFVMMIIFGAMAQLVPVVLEVGHFAVDLYYVIYPLLLIGTILMALGFYSYPLLLPFGGIIAFISFGIFLFETFLTIFKVKKLNFVITSVLIANIFLLLGLIIGIVMSLGYAGVLDVDIYSLLKTHVYMVLFGYVGITIMGMSLILLPMFWLSHNFSWIYVKTALVFISLGIVSVSFSSFSSSVLFEYLGYMLSLVALFLYFYQIYVIYKKRVRLENDVYFKSIFFSFSSLIICLLLGLIYLVFPSNRLLLGISWLAFAGFISYVIIGHLYKIVPFLVWFERFSPLVGKKKVPMLADMIPVKSANIQLFSSFIGIIIITIGIFFSSNDIYKTGVSFLLIGAVFLVKDIFYMINFKGEDA